MSEQTQETPQSSGARPPGVFSAGQLLDDDKLKNGPLDILWNQDEWIEPNTDRVKAASIDPGPKKLRWRLVRAKPFRIDIRLAPPPGEDLETWGKALADHLGLPWTNTPQDGDKAVWLPGAVWAKHAAGALGSAGQIFTRLDGFMVGQAAIRVQRLKRAA